MYFIIFVIASHHRWRGNPVNYARAYARLYYDWIATVAMLPRDDKIGKCVNKKIKHRAKFPSMEGVPRSGGVVRKCKNVLHPYSPLSSWGAGSPQKRMFLWGAF